MKVYYIKCRNCGRLSPLPSYFYRLPHEKLNEYCIWEVERWLRKKKIKGGKMKREIPRCPNCGCRLKREEDKGEQVFLEEVGIWMWVRLPRIYYLCPNCSWNSITKTQLIKKES